MESTYLPGPATVDRARSRRRLFFIGSLDVAPTYGGPIQFHRHFVERHDFVFAKAVETAQPRLSQLRTRIRLLDRIIDRATRTRLFPHFVALNEWLAVRRIESELLARAREFEPDAIVTVAFGSYGMAAVNVARRLNLPLISFYHDWWPDLALASRWGIRVFDRQMRRLYRQSDLVFCVCEEMRRELGDHPNARILYPIGATPSPVPPREPPPRPRLVYLGGMSKGYGRMLVALTRAYAAHADERPWELAIFGPTRDWRKEDVEFATRAGVYRGERFGAAARQELANTDIFLVVMDFERPTMRRVRTSFPSKILESCTFGRPVIGWAPSYSSLAGFARRTNFPEVHTDEDAHSFVDAIDRFVHDPARLAKNAAAAAHWSATEFAADRIHAELVREIHAAIDRRQAHAAVPRRLASNAA